MNAVISSRTPDGAPGECPVCSASIYTQPSWPAGDAPCPNCGSLVWFDTNEWCRTFEPDDRPVPCVTGQSPSREALEAIFERVQTTLADVRAVGVHDWNIENLRGLIARFDQALGMFEALEEGILPSDVRTQAIEMLEELEELVLAHEHSAWARRSNQYVGAGLLSRSLRLRPLVTSVSRLANWVASAFQPAHRADSSFGNVYDHWLDG
jgi:hypothetical protein